MNGTLSHINFCTIEHQTGDEMPVIGEYGPAFAEALRPYIERLNAASGLIRYREAEEMALKLKEENADFSQLSDNEAFEVLSFRANVIAYHKAMLLYIMEGQWSEEIAQFMRWSEEYDLWCKMQFFGSRLLMQMRQDHRRNLSGPQNMLDLLPDTFTRDELKALRLSMGMNSDPRVILSKWKARQFIELNADTGCYQKSEYYLSKHRA